MRKSLKRGTWKGLELFLGGVWGGFWERFGGFGGLAGRFLTSFFHACIWDGLQKRSWRGQGWILLRFWGVWGGILGGIWPGFDSDFKGFWAILDFSCSLAGSMACFCLLGPAWACFG